MREIAEGIVHWTAEHPNIRQRVSSYLVVPSATLIDPLLPDGGTDAIAEIVRPDRVVLTNRHHVRDIRALVDTFGCSVHVHEKGTAPFQELPVSPRPFAFGDEVAPGITALEVGSITPEETALRIDVGDGALAFADGFLNDGGRVGFMPDGLLGEDPELVKRGLRLAAARLLDERFAHLLFAHGDPIVGDGREALQAVSIPEG
jgi:hypothetical protein